MIKEARHATLRAYGEMRGHGLSDRRAFESAVSVLRHRLPEMAPDDARFIAADWICEDLGQ